MDAMGAMGSNLVGLGQAAATAFGGDNSDRRLKRDIQSRGRTVESIINQYKDTVKPMHQQFVETHHCR